MSPPFRSPGAGFGTMRGVSAMVEVNISTIRAMSYNILPRVRCRPLRRRTFPVMDLSELLRRIIQCPLRRPPGLVLIVVFIMERNAGITRMGYINM